MEEPCVKFEILPHRQFGIERETLRHVADAAAHADAVAVDRLSEEPRLALAGGQKPGQHLHGCRLAAAIGAEKTEDLAAADAETDLVDGDEIAEAHGEIARLDRRLAIFAGGARRNLDRPVRATLFLGQQRDEGGLERGGAGLRTQVRRRAAGQHPAGIHRHQPVEALGLLHIGGGHDDAHLRPPGTNAGDQLPEMPARQRIDAGGRLVEDQQIGIVDQRAAEAELLLHAARKLAGRPVGKGRKPGAVEQGRDAGLAMRAVMAEQPAEEIDILEDRQCRIEIAAEALRHVGDARTDPVAVPRPGHVAAKDLDAALLQRAGTGNQGQQARLADTVRSDQPDHLPGRNVERHAVERAVPAIAERDVGEPRNGRRRNHSGSLICSAAGHSSRGSRRT